MKKLMHILIFFLFLFCFFESQFAVNAENQNFYVVEENFKTISNFLKNQAYYEDVAQLCHEEVCFSIDVHDLSKSLQVMEDKVLRHIENRYGTDARLEASLKGFAITKIILH